MLLGILIYLHFHINYIGRKSKTFRLILKILRLIYGMGPYYIYPLSNPIRESVPRLDSTAHISP